MARTVLTKTTAPGGFPTTGTVATFEAADPTNKNSFVMTGRETLLVRNVHATDPKTVTINSAADEMGRTGDITALSIDAGDVVVLGPFKDKTGWAQTGGVLHLEGETTDIEFCVIVG